MLSPSLVLIRKWISYLFLLMLPTQLGTFFFLPQSFIDGIRIDYLAPAFYLTDTLFVLLLLLSIPHFLRSIKSFTRVYRHLLANRKILVIIAALVLVTVLAIEPVIGLYRIFKLIEVFGIFFVIKQQEMRLRTFLFILIASAALQLLLVVYQTTTGHTMQGIAYFLGERSFTLSTPGIAKVSLDGREVLRGYGSFSHPNSLAGFFLLLFGYILFEQKFRAESILKYLFLAITTILIVFSFSKIAITGLVILSVVSAVKNSINCTLCKVSRIIIPVIVALIVFAAQGDTESQEKRIWLAQSAILIIQQHPIFGVGLGNYLYAQSQFAIPYSYFFLQPVHNIFLLLLAEIGIPLFAFVTYLFLKHIKQIISSPAAKAVLFVIVFTGMFDHYWLTLQQNILLLPVVFGLLQTDEHMVQ